MKANEEYDGIVATSSVSACDNDIDNCVCCGTMPSREQVMADYHRNVVRCSDGQPAISFMSWCHYVGLNPWEL